MINFHAFAVKVFKDWLKNKNNNKWSPLYSVQICVKKVEDYESKTKHIGILQVKTD